MEGQMSVLPPLPGGSTDFAVDEKFRGATPAQDRVIDALHREGWTLQRIFTEPLAMLPLPEDKFPPGRVYLFSEEVAVVVKRSNGSVITSLPTHAALQTLEQYTPEVLEQDDWARQRMEELVREGSEAPLYRRHHRQTFYDRDGGRWAVSRLEDGVSTRARILRDGDVVLDAATGDEAEAAGLDPIIADLVDYVLEGP